MLPYSFREMALVACQCRSFYDCKTLHKYLKKAKHQHKCLS